MKARSIARILAVGLVVFGLSLAESGLSRHRMALRDLAAFRAKQIETVSSIEPPKATVEKAPPEPRPLRAADRNARSSAPPRQHPAVSGLPLTQARDLVLVSTNPDLRELFLRNFRANLARRFGEFYWAAGLSPRQVSQFEDLAVARQAAAIDLAAVAVAHGLEDTDPAIAGTRAQQDADLQAAQSALLGDAGYQRLQQFEREDDAVGWLNNFAAIGAGGGDAYLTYAQAGQLLQVIANASHSFQRGGAVDRNSVNWDQVVAQATDILPPALLAALKTEANYRTLTSQVLPAYLAQHPGP